MRAYMKMTTILMVTLGSIFLAAVIGATQDKETAGTSTDAQNAGGNSKCYVCHASLKTEDITVGHLAMDVTCDQCHGPSVEHMHDEMLMTEPDLLFGRSEVNRMCSNPSCHAPGGERTVFGLQDHADPAKVRQFHEEWLGRTRPNGRAIARDPVCTDCHGTHNLDEPLRGNAEEEASEWVALFNGSDLAGWDTADAGAWTVRRGRLIGTLKSDGAPGGLFTHMPFDNYLLTVTFQADRSVHAGLWLHHTTTDPGPRVEIFDGADPLAYTGSIRVPGKGLALANLRADLTDREGWNTLSIKVEKDRIQVWLNAEEVGAATVPGRHTGHIGLHLQSHSGSTPAEIQVREVLVKRLPDLESSGR